MSSRDGCSFFKSTLASCKFKNTLFVGIRVYKMLMAM